MTLRHAAFNDTSEKSMETQSTQTNRFIIPSAIVVAGVIVAAGLYFGLAESKAGAPAAQGAEQSGNLEGMRAVTSEDHIRGNPNAPVKIVEYSDTECPFCKRFHDTMKQTMAEYGESGKVAWVYRHFPLAQLHSRAAKEAEATECAGEQGGNDAFWAYLDRLFSVTPSNDGLDPAELPKIAQYVGLDSQKFEVCLSSGRYAAHVEADTQNANETGGNGTPWSIVVGKGGKKYPLSGAQPYEEVRRLIEQALAE